jgi:WD40 repeat protein
MRNLASFKASVHAVQLNSDGTTAIASDGRESVWVDLRTATVTRTLPLKASYTHGVSISPDGARIACSYGSDVTTWETETALTRTLDAEHRELQWCVLFTPDGRRLLSGGRGCVSVWDTTTGQQTATISLGSIQYVQTIAVSRDGTLLAAVPSAAGQTVFVFRLPE